MLLSIWRKQPPNLMAAARHETAVHVITHGSDTTQRVMEKIHKAFSGYIHANYAHVMEVYNGGKDDFNLAGVPSPSRRAEWMQYVEVAVTSVLLAAAFIAQALGMHELHGEFVELLD
ncbi:hypothetical protein [Magnetospirillum sp. 15-1]|uniref:hypothetical protein n=1 Tax=Magnetospirillum sp. 15-1 TaxID=1979370 RepID=UPI00114133D0|nr:hypothetical protein [Magnetospirillum sp. 15-1]